MTPLIIVISIIASVSVVLLLLGPYWQIQKLRKDTELKQAVLTKHLEDLWKEAVNLSKEGRDIYKLLIGVKEHLATLDGQDLKIMGHISEIQDALMDFHANVSVTYQTMAAAIEGLSYNELNQLPPISLN